MSGTLQHHRIESSQKPFDAGTVVHSRIGDAEAQRG